MESLIIRKTTVNDAGAICQLLRQLNWFPRFTTTPPGELEAPVRQHIARCLADDSHSTYVAEQHEGDLAGYIAVHWLPCLFLGGPEGYISELFVREAERGRGIGARLTETVKREAKARGCSRLMVANSRSRDSYKRGFFQKLGWLEREHVANFIYKFE